MKWSSGDYIEKVLTFKIDLFCFGLFKLHLKALILYLFVFFTYPFCCLELIQRKNDELALVLEEQGESVNNVGNKVLGSKGSNASVHQFSGANSTSTSTMYTDEFDSSVAMLNIVCSFCSLY